MNLGQMIEEFRIEADDNAEPNLFSENEVRFWLNQGMKEAARRSHLFLDSSTPSVCQIPVVAGQAEYVLDPKVIHVARVTVPSMRNLVLYAEKAEIMDACMPNWEAASSPTPQCYVVGKTARRIQIYPAPTTNYTLQLAVIRLPLADMESPADAPEDVFGEEYHSGVVQWAVYRAYSKKDAETLDEEKAKRALESFEMEFGTREEANAALEQLMAKQSYVFNKGR